jgi:HSF-type DNA-binding
MVKTEVPTTTNLAEISSVREERNKTASSDVMSRMNSNMGVPEDTDKANTVLSPYSSMQRRRRTVSCSPQSSKEEKKVSKVSSKKTKAKHEQDREQQSSPTTLTTKGFQRHYAEHDYHDYAQAKPTEMDLQSIKASRGGVHNPFPTVLHNMMEQADAQDFANIVSWQPHGRAFLIHDPKGFVQHVLPMFFKHSKISSFQRQLSLYGFIRLSHDGPDRGAYYHQCFLRGRSFLCSNIQRTRIKGTWVRTSSSPEAEPDFYRMDPVDVPPPQPSGGGHVYKNMPSWLTSFSTGTTVKAVLDEAIHSSTGCNLLFDDEAADPTTVSLLQPSSKRSCAVAAEGSMKTDKAIPWNQPPDADSGLLAPPAFPSEVWSRNPTIQSEGKPFWPILEDWTPKADHAYTNALEKLSLPFSLPTTLAPIRDDDELARFLTEIDLETELDSEFDGFVRTALV